MKITCQNCGKLFVSYESRPQKFCCRACYTQYKTEHPEQYDQRKGHDVPCEMCGKLVYRKPSDTRAHIYCSRTCANQHQSQALAKNPEWRQGKGVELICLECGKPYRTKAYNANKRKYCSYACACDARFGTRLNVKKHRDTTGEKNPNYRHGQSMITARKMALKAFGHKCMICKFNVVVSVHHITPRREGGTNTIDNLIVLCPNHHAMADRGLISRDNLKHIVLAAIARLSDRLPLFDQPLSPTPENVQLDL